LQLSKLIFACCLLPLCAAGLAAAAPDVTAIAKAVDEHYNHLRSLQAEFTEVYRGSGVERTESGTLWLKKPGKMRWEYRSPREKLFLSDGRSVWFYVKGDRQVRKAGAKQLDDVRSPIAFLLGKLKLEKELHGLSIAVDQAPLAVGDTVVRGIPTGMADRVSGVLVEITPQQQIARIVIEEPDGAATEFRFDRQQENVEVPDGSFRFVQPEGVEVIEGAFNP
jgi:outer membrane lipoprotein carrier protein